MEERECYVVCLNNGTCVNFYAYTFAEVVKKFGEEDVWQYPRQVNDAKRAFAEESENNYFIDTIGAGMHTNIEPLGEPDKCHYDSDSQIMLGHLFAEAFEKFLIK